MDSEYWNGFYSGTFSLDIPSQFCAMFCQEAERGKAVIEFGCGNGRDSRVMASHGFRVLGVDASESAIAYCIEHAAKVPGSLQYMNSDVASLDVDAMKAFVGGEHFYVYSRFFQHSITEEEQKLMFGALIKMQPNVTAFFEFRNHEDKDALKLFGQHYRRFQSPEFFAEVLSKHGFDIEYSVSGKGHAKYFDEDPNVTRFIARLEKNN